MWSQKIIDPCFTSVKESGYFSGSSYLINLCGGCESNYYAADLIEWNGADWVGRHEYSDVDLPPPEGCSIRALWIGPHDWTYGGEGFALKLDKPIEAGKTYSYTFTYASDGLYDNDEFRPVLYTHSNLSSPSFSSAYFVTYFPSTDDWNTATITFMAKSFQEGHEWIIIRTLAGSGIILSNCEISLWDQLENLGDDILMCKTDSIEIGIPPRLFTQYTWSTGDTLSLITVSDADQYVITINNDYCTATSSIDIFLEDCEVRLIMPNFFSPNGDGFNPSFIPKEYNNIQSGEMIIYNRWGSPIFKNNLFTGWDGTTDGKDCSSGVYYYKILYTSTNGENQVITGWVTLMR